MKNSLQRCYGFCQWGWNTCYFRALRDQIPESRVLASQRTKTSAAFACAASCDQRDRIMRATIVTYCRRLRSNTIYLPDARLVNLSCVAAFYHDIKSNDGSRITMSKDPTLNFIILVITKFRMWSKHGSRAFAPVQWVPKRALPIYCKVLTGSSSPAGFRSFRSKVVE